MHTLEKLLKGLNQAYNRRRQRVLKGASPEQIGKQRLAAEPNLANVRFEPPGPRVLPQALQVVAHAKEVSHLDRTTNPYMFDCRRCSSRAQCPLSRQRFQNFTKPAKKPNP
jgi:hypothetical protein